jgi:hypothetical protein
MKRATITIPDDLEAELERYLSEQPAPPSLTAVLQAALRDYLQNAALAARGYRPPSQPFDPSPLEEKDDAGEPDVSMNHDLYIGKP